MEPPTVSEILAHCGVTAAQLVEPCSSVDITKIAGFLGSWREVAPCLSLDENDVKEIDEDGRDAAERRLKALQKWKAKFGFKATYKWLVEVLVEVKMAECAEKVCKVLKAHYRCTPGGIQPTASLPTGTVVSDSGELHVQAQATKQTGQLAEEEPDHAPEVQQTVGSGSGDQPLATIPSRPVGPLTEEQSFDVSSAFADMYSKLVPQLAKVLPANTLKRYLASLCHPITNQPYVVPSLYQHLTSTEAVLDVLQQERYFHPIQTSLLRKIVESYGCNDCKHLLKEYEAKIPKTTPLRSSELTDNEIDSSSTTVRLKVKVDQGSTTPCLEVIKTIQEALERSSGISQVVIVYAKHESGCILLTFLIPATMVEAFTNIRTSKENLSYLADVGILSIQIDQATIEIKAQVQQKIELCETEEFTHTIKLKPTMHSGSSLNVAGPEWTCQADQVLVGGEREAFLLASFGPISANNPDVIPLQGTGELSEEDRRKLDSQGVPPDCCDDVSIVRARITLDSRYQLSGDEVSDTGRELTRGYVLGQLEEFLNSVDKPFAIIYYIGHGKKRTGDWCFSDGFITFSDIIHLYHTTNIKGRLLAIVTNCSYSGAWVKECCQYL